MDPQLILAINKSLHLYVDQQVLENAILKAFGLEREYYPATHILGQLNASSYTSVWDYLKAFTLAFLRSTPTFRQKTSVAHFCKEVDPHNRLTDYALVEAIKANPYVGYVNNGWAFPKPSYDLAPSHSFAQQLEEDDSFPSYKEFKHALYSHHNLTHTQGEAFWRYVFPLVAQGDITYKELAKEFHTLMNLCQKP